MIRELDVNELNLVAGGVLWEGRFESTYAIDCRNDPYPCLRSMVRGGDEYPVDRNGEFVFD